MSSATFVLFVREPPRRLCRPLYCQGLCQLSEQYPMSLIYTFSLISCNPIKKMSPEDTSGVSPSPPSPSTTDTVTKMIKNNNRKVIIGASSVLVLMIIIIIVATTTVVVVVAGAYLDRHNFWNWNYDLNKMKSKIKILEADESSKDRRLTDIDRIDKMGSRITILETDMEKMKTKITELDQKIESLETREITLGTLDFEPGDWGR